MGRVVGLELRACVQTTTAVSAAGSSRRTAPHGPACRPAAPSQSALCLYFVILSSSYYRISSVISCVCAPPSIRILLPSVAHQFLYPCVTLGRCPVRTDGPLGRLSVYHDMPTPTAFSGHCETSLTAPVMSPTSGSSDIKYSTNLD